MSAPTSALFSHPCVFSEALFFAQSEQESAPFGKVTSSWNRLPQPIGGSSGSLAPASQISTWSLSRIRFLLRGRSGGRPSTSPTTSRPSPTVCTLTCPCRASGPCGTSVISGAVRVWRDHHPETSAQYLRHFDRATLILRKNHHGREQHDPNRVKNPGCRGAGCFPRSFYGKADAANSRVFAESDARIGCLGDSVGPKVLPAITNGGPALCPGPDPSSERLGWLRFQQEPMIVRCNGSLHSFTNSLRRSLSWKPLINYAHRNA